MEYYNNTLCVSGSELIITDGNPNGIISKPTWDKLKRTGVRVVRRACNGNTALIDFSTLPQKYKDMVATQIGVPAEQAATKPFKDKIIADPRAITYFGNYLLADARHLPAEKQREYAINASVLNAIKDVYTSAKESRAKLGVAMSGFWGRAIAAVNDIRVETGHTLPSKQIPLQRTFTKYLTNSYSALISGKYCNDNSRKVDDGLENLIMSLYAMPNKPFASQVHVLYTMFLHGKITVADRKTGEIYDPNQFIKNGEPVEISETTVWNYLNQPHNRAVVDKVRMGAHRYNSTHRPHHHRTSPVFSFSKISMDDRDLPRKCTNGKWVKSYYAYDVTSGCVIGYAHSLYKNEELFLDCMRNMLRLIEREGFGMPMEVEVENHLVNKFFDDLALMFPYLRVCRPGNSQEKRAEHFNRAKKYGEEKKSQNNIGRWWSKHEAYTVDRDKKGDEFVDKVVLPYERLEADDIQSIHNYNNQLHPKQKKYPGKTRWQVLVENMNPEAPQVNKALVYKTIGHHAPTSINRNQYVQVRGRKFQIPGVKTMEKLLPGNLSVDAYFLPDGEGFINEVYLYQSGVFVCKADKLVVYNESKAEQTPEDFEAFKKQAAFVAEYDANTREAKKELGHPVIIQNTVLKEALATPTEIKIEIEEKFDVNNALDQYSQEDDEQSAIDNL
jgi:hypothetical protein